MHIKHVFSQTTVKRSVGIRIIPEYRTIESHPASSSNRFLFQNTRMWMCASFEIYNLMHVHPRGLRIVCKIVQTYNLFLIAKHSNEIFHEK